MGMGSFAEPVHPGVCQGRNGERVALQEVELHATLHDLLCEVRTVQVYRNAEDRAIEVVYTFPLPLDAVLLDVMLPDTDGLSVCAALRGKGIAAPVLMVMMAIERIGAGMAAQAGMVGPLSTILMGIWILGEPFTLWLAAGTALAFVRKAIPCFVSDTSTERSSASALLRSTSPAASSRLINGVSVAESSRSASPSSPTVRGDFSHSANMARYCG